jgi:hypothetical protein
LTCCYWTCFVFIITPAWTIFCGPEQAPLLAAKKILGRQDSPSAGERVSVVKKLYQEKRWRQMIELTPPSPGDSAELDYYRGLALTHLEYWAAAEQALRAGQQKQPHDKRFPLELAGIAFKQKNYSEAKVHLRLALRLDPHDAYGLDFLATVELLSQNLEAALELWNRIEKPRIRELQTDPQPRLDAVLLDHAFAFSPASVLRLEDYRTTRARLDLLGIFPRYQFELRPRTGEISGEGSKNQPARASEDRGANFDLVFHNVERNGWGESRLEGALSLLRGLPYETLYPEYLNLKRSAMNFSSLVRWDKNKRRVFASFSSPLHRDPRWRYELYADARNEYWDLSQTFHAAGLPLTNLNLQKLEAGAGIRSVVNGRWDWNVGLEISDRWFRNLQGDAAPFFANGPAIKYRAGFDYKLLQRPQGRFTLDSSLSAQAGRFFVSPSSLFFQTQGSLWTRWFPKPNGDDFETIGRLRSGKSAGRLPFDELFILGLERDNDLWLRAHIGTRGGKKGNAPLGRDYILSNWEVNKNIYQSGPFNVRLAPFLDCGRVYDDADGFGSQKWLWDTGGQAKLKVLGGLTLVFTYGKDLRSGRDAYYFTVEP